MRIVKTTKAKKGGKSHSKATAKKHIETKTKAVNAFLSNMMAQEKQMEIQALRYALEKYLGRELVKADADKIKKLRKEKESGYVLEFDGVKLGRIDRQHAVDPKETPNFRIVFTAFSTHNALSTLRISKKQFDELPTDQEIADDISAQMDKLAKQ